MENKKPFSPIVRSASWGYVIENFIGPNVYTGEETELLTTNGKICVFPNMESVPPKWRQYARPASQLEAMLGERMPFRVNIITEEVIE